MTDAAPTVERKRFIDPSLHRITQYSSVRNFVDADAIPAGYNVIHEGGLPIDIQVNDRGHDATIVSLHGAVTPDHRLPYMAGQAVTREVAANRIFISDASLMLDPKLNLAWFAGSARLRLQLALPAIIKRIVADRPEVKRLIFFGSSGGGFASLFYASRFPGSIAVVSNPQTAIGRYIPAAVENYVRVAFDGTSNNPISRLPFDVVDDVVPIYAHAVDVTVLYAQNSTDAMHVTGHARPFFESLHPDNRAWWYASSAWGAGHVAPPKEVFTEMLHAAVATDVGSAAEAMGFQRARGVDDLRLK